MKIAPPIIVVPSWDCFGRNCRDVMTKGLGSSLLRSLFSGKIMIFRGDSQPLFKVERVALTEVASSQPYAHVSSIMAQDPKIKCVAAIVAEIDCQPRQWVAIAHFSSLGLRNIDHLFPPDFDGLYGKPQVDLLWARAGKDEISNHSATPGLWAVRGEDLPIVLDRLKEEWSKDSGAESASEEEIWTRVVHELPLRKRAFEKGEVVAPRMGAVDWEAVSNAAFVTVPDWPEKEAWKFLQALYFGTYLGDETGMMLNILEA